jgi:hypothetical protein
MGCSLPLLRNLIVPCLIKTEDSTPIVTKQVHAITLHSSSLLPIPLILHQLSTMQIFSRKNEGSMTIFILTVILHSLRFSVVHGGQGSLRLSEESLSMLETKKLETQPNMPDKLDAEIIVSPAPTPEIDPSRHNSDNPCLGAETLSLQVQLWCEYHHNLGVI